MQWDTIPTKLQRELFDTAGSLGDVLQTVALRGQSARFLHSHKDESLLQRASRKTRGTTGNLMAHKFDSGQTVEVESSLLRSIIHGPYEIRNLIPAPDRDSGDPCYRVKSVDEKYERVVSESEIALSKTAVA